MSCLNFGVHYTAQDVGDILKKDTLSLKDLENHDKTGHV
jgi:hypothetical protein